MRTFRSLRYLAAAALAGAAATSLAAPTGKEVYEATCIACHGADGKGAIPGVPDLRGPMKAGDELILKRLRDGYQSPGSPMAMPAKGGNASLTDGDLKAVIIYMRKSLVR